MDEKNTRYLNNDWCYEECKRRRCRGIYHLIEKGDTLYGLSRRYKVSVEAIMRANPGVNIYNLHINDEICIPVDFAFDYIQDDEKTVEIESNKSKNYFSENDSVKEMLAKAGKSMDELLYFINSR